MTSDNSILPTLQLRPDQWIWDLWLTQDKSDYHLFYLQAPRSLQDPDKRHWNVSIGHAISEDLHHWKILPDAIQSGPLFDKYTWTGSTIYHDGLWYLFYTLSLKEENGLIQRISFATSSDLIHWQQHPQPIIEADPFWYEELDLNVWYDQAWRDPWVFQHPDTGKFHALITARANYGSVESRGVIAHAISQNLMDWQVMPPLTEPTNFPVMECPQLLKIQGRYYLLFSSPLCQWNDNISLTGMFYMIADNPLGPFSEPKILFADPVGQLYAGKLIQGTDKHWYFIAWRNLAPDGSFLGDLIKPLPIAIDEEGLLSLPSLTDK